MSRTQHGYARGDLVVVVDCADLERAARFWAGALGYVSADGADGASYRSLLPPGGVGAEVLLQRTEDAKQGKNRVHLDLRTRDLDAEVGRVTALGATVLTGSPLAEHGWAWHVLADPDGNEFCILQPPADYWADSSRELPASGLVDSALPLLLALEPHRPRSSHVFRHCVRYGPSGAQGFHDHVRKVFL